jgi:hypothetical protein
VACICEYGNEISGYIICGDFLTSFKPVCYSTRILRRGVTNNVNSEINIT